MAYEDDDACLVAKEGWGPEQTCENSKEYCY